MRSLLVTNTSVLLLQLLLILRSSRASWIDPDTPKQFHTTTALVDKDKREYELVRDDIWTRNIGTFFGKTRFAWGLEL